MAEKNTWDMISERASELADLYARMDETSKFLYWDDNPYSLTKPDGKTVIKDALSVTPNKPKVFAHGIVSNLLDGKWQTVVEGKISSRQSHVIEQFIEDNFTQADEFLQTAFRIPSLFNWLCNHVCIRGFIGAHWLASEKEKQYKIHCAPVDMRWCPFEDGKNGLADGWISPITFRSKESLQKEYPKASISGTTDIEVRNYWDAEKNEIWIDSKLALQQKNPFGYPPFVVMIPSAGFMLRDKGYLKHEGEDILFLNKGLFLELARTLSLEQTLGYSSLFPGYEYEVEDVDATPSVAPPPLDSTLKRRKGERHIPVPRGDMNRAGISARTDILQMIEEGGITSPRSYNTPPSAVELYGEAELIGQLQNSRKDCIGAFRSQLAMMIIDQAIKISKGGQGVDSLEIGGRGRKNTYSTGQLGDPDKYYITYHLMVKSKRQELANLAQFSAVYGKLPLKYNLTNILMAEDPDGIIKELEIEEARKADPAIALFEMAVKYAEEADDLDDPNDADVKRIQSKMLTERGVAIIKQRQQPLTPAQTLPEKARVPQVEQPKGGGNLLPPLLGGQGVTGKTRQPQEVL